MKCFKIGNVKIDNQTVLAPLAGVNCTAFRVLCKESGAGLIYTQLYDSDGITAMYDEDKRRFENLLNITDAERPVTIQLIGSNPDTMGRGAEILSRYADIIDINLGCPDKNFLGKQSGAFFSKHPEQIPKIAEPVIANSKVPVTAKVRVGWDDNTITVLDTVRILQELGIAAIAVHGRTRKQMYSGKARWDLIRKAKEAVKIPIIGNGDITKPGNAKSMLELTGCDAVMVGRGAMGNPLIFDRINYLLKNNKNKEDITPADRLSSFLRFTKLYKKYERNKSVSEFKTHAMWFTKTSSDARKRRNRIRECQSIDEIVRIVKE